MKKLFLSFAVLLTSLLVQAQFNYFKGVLSGANESTPNSSTATGVVVVKYNNVSNVLELYGHYRDLSSTISGSHIHQAPAGSPGPVVVPLTNTGGTTGTLSVTATLTAEQETALLAEGLYVNVHSSTFPEGEIRAQLTFTSSQYDFLTARIQGSQEVPPTPTNANGHAIVLLDRGTNMLYLTGSYNGLTADISGSHIHAGLPGVSGGVIISLVNSGGTTGVLEAAAVAVTDAQETQISSGGSYVNVHSSTFTAGEIRGQLTNSAQVTFFAGSLSGSQQPTANASPAQGTVIVRYDPVTNLLELTGDYQGLTSPITGASIYGSAPYGSDAGATALYAITHTGGTTGTLTLSTTITDAQETDLYSGLFYVNVLSGSFTAGEIRTQLYYTSMGHSYYFNGFLQGAQEVPSSGSSGSGTVTSLLDAMTGIVYVTGSFSGLGSNATMAHIHQAMPGQSGPPILTLSVSPAMAGTVTGSGTLTADQIAAMINGGTYVNIHSELIGTGELRAQLGNLVLPVKLTSFTAFKEREKITLSWTTVQESNVLSYDIEQQDPETKAWIKKGTVKANGGNETINYRFVDVPSSGRSPIVLYRLRMNDVDGKVAYSYVIRVNFQMNRGELTLLSNPVRNGVVRFVITGLSTAERAEASVVDYNGRIISKARVSLLGTNEINVSQLPAGMYRLVVTLNKEVMQQSFVK